MLELKAQKLTPEAFAPFGDVIDARISESFAINGGRTQRHHDLARVEILDAPSRPLISVFVSQPVTLPLELELLERHPLGSQAFMPLHEERFIVVVAPPGDDIDPDGIRAFVTDGRQGVNYRAGTWHAIHSVLEREGEFLVVDRAGADNLDERPMAIRVVV
ncbi:MULTISPECIES: ureidoglycolate lyase [Salinicola]|uniref:ureidoglycolate lyase n=1 Tax=Salinicola TaxID=404432 RepID=UPI0008DD9B9C|nr:MULTISPECIES: ureidoglycolate lyase [Salinicola]MDF3918053.1 ureidoglycolate lyase [Salinicola salarius]MEC8918198.1 ureidoglycolate lyase [Pseudomonadota bacterium]MED5501862.1 ureidoglycolate lyase [Pseudomonadota bacterium]OHZ02979.1 ureidoglycolate hydrolase [Salinicola sp. MIT1003]